MAIDRARRVPSNAAAAQAEAVRPLAPAAAPVAGPGKAMAAAVRERPLLVACAATAAAVAVALAAFTPRYETNDDVTMNLVAAGLLVTDRPDEHLLYSNVLIGLPLRALYGAWPAVPWYGLYHYATLCAAAAAACYALLRVNPTGRQAAVALFFLAVVVLPCLVGLQFTKTAFLACLAGLLLLLAPLRGAAPWPKSADAAGVALIVLGSLIRFQSFALALVVAAPVAAAGALPAPRRALRRAALPGLAAVLALALNAYNARYYARSPGWEDFYAYNALRAEFTDYQRYYPYSPEMNPALAAAGWDPVDLGMMQFYFFADPQRYSLDKLQRFTAVAPHRPAFVPRRITGVLNYEVRRYPDLLTLLVAAACPPLLAGGGWRRFVMPAVLAATALVLVVALAAFYWFPAHVGYCLFSGVVAAGALGPPPQNGRGSRAGKGRLLRAVVLFAVGVAVWSVKDTEERHATRSREHDIMRTVIRLFRPGRDKIYVLWADMLKLEKVVYPFEDAPGLRDFRFVWLSSLFPTPFTERRLRDCGIDDVFRAICERPDVFFVGREDSARMYRYYMRHHYGIETNCEVMFPGPQDYHLLPIVPPEMQFLVLRVTVASGAAVKGDAQETAK
jgi:hypothetical protein